MFLSSFLFRYCEGLDVHLHISMIGNEQDIDENNSSIHLTSGCLQTFTATLYSAIVLSTHIDRTSDIKITIPYDDHILLSIATCEV